MNATTSTKQSEELMPVERLVGVADSIFERANTLDNIKFAKKEDEAAATIAETRDDAFGGCIQVWRIVITLLPTSGLPQAAQTELEIDGHKVISRCFQRLGRLEDAKKSIARAIDKGYLEGFISMGAICLEMENFEEAQNALESALNKGVHTMRAHAGLGELFFKMGTEALKKDPNHREYFVKAEEEFLSAGKERFTESYERAMELFDTIGWKERAADFGEKALHFYTEHRTSYGEKLRNLDGRVRQIAGDERHDKIVEGVTRALGGVFGRTKKE